MTARLDRVGAAVVNVLRLLPAAADEEPGHASPHQLAAGLAVVLRARLGPVERLALASAAMMALDAEEAGALAEAMLADLRAIAPAELEAERIRRQWAAHCAASDYRPPTLNRREEREAARIRLEDTPRARLAEAWQTATERDRRDLLNRATGRAA